MYVHVSTCMLYKNGQLLLFQLTYSIFVLYAMLAIKQIVIFAVQNLFETFTFQ